MEKQHKSAPDEVDAVVWLIYQVAKGALLGTGVLVFVWGFSPHHKIASFPEVCLGAGMFIAALLIHAIRPD